MSEPFPSTCAVCGTPFDAETADGCPRCLMVAAMVPTEPAGEEARQAPPSLEAVAGAFPQLEILEFIGQGGMGCVFKARQPKLDRLVALKLLPASLAKRDAAFAGRFEREGQLLARLHHPNIVAVHDSGTAGEFFYLIMEFVDGVNLRQAMRTRRFTPAQALAIVPHICDALQYAHDEGVLHRDVKPENILLDAKGRVKLADFGIAKLLADSDTPTATTATAGASLTQSGSALGTPQYMAPEQHDTPADVDHRADIYSLGVVFYELLTGELPRERFAPPSAKSDADRRVDAIVQQALEKERNRRQHSAGEVKTQVQQVTSSASIAATARRSHSWWRRNLRRVAAGVVIAFILRTWFVQAFVTEGNSAAPEIPHGSRFLVWKFTHHFSPGDLVAYREGERAFVGRVTRVSDSQIEVRRNATPDIAVAKDVVIGRVFSVFWRGPAIDETSPPAPSPQVDLEGIFKEYEGLLTALREATFELELVGVSADSETEKQEHRAGIKKKCDQLAAQTATLREKILLLGKRADEVPPRPTFNPQTERSTP